MARYVDCSVEMKTKSKQLVGAALKIIGLAGFAGTFVVAPKASTALIALLDPVLSTLDMPEQKRILRILKRQNLVQVDAESEDGYRITVTPAGAYRLQSEQLENVVVPQMKKWDGHWRLVCYDIPSGKNKERYALTHHLHRMGFSMIQKSMWAHPHACIEQVTTITDALMVSRYVSVLEVVKLDEHTTNRLIRQYHSLIRI